MTRPLQLNWYRLGRAIRTFFIHWNKPGASFLCRKVGLSLPHVFEVKKRHDPRIAIKAIDEQTHHHEDCQQIQEYDARTDEEIKKFIIDPQQGPLQALVFRYEGAYRAISKGRVESHS